MAGPRSQSASENIVIRGLAPDYNLSTFDGAPIATASESNRAANLSLFPPAIVGRVEAIKTISADMNPHGLSGQLNLITTSAFDRDEPFGNLRVSVGENSTAGKVVDDQGENIRATGLYATSFGSQDQFGFVAAGSFEKFYATTRAVRPGGESGTYYFYTDDPASNATVDSFADPNGFAAPRRNQIYLFENEQERASAVAKLEWRPSAATYASLFGGGSTRMNRKFAMNTWRFPTRASALKIRLKTQATGRKGVSKPATFISQRKRLRLQLPAV